MMKITEQVVYVGVNDRTKHLFENLWPLPYGVSYNSYLVVDEKVALIDTVDAAFMPEYIEKIKSVLGERQPDYVIINHVEPDHSGALALLRTHFPEAKLVGNKKTAEMIKGFYGVWNEDDLIVADGDELQLGTHCLNFRIVPMVHWPETMVAYDASDRVLFSADAFGKFGVYDADADDWTCEARRYYFNIVGKYGAPVQVLLKKIADLDIRVIAPLHGPVLSENLQFYIDKYHTWSSYEPEDKGVFIAVASIHGHTLEAAEMMAEKLRARGVKVAMSDLSREDIAEAVEDAFRYDRLLLAAASYDGGVFTPMEFFLSRLKHKNYQKRRVAILENGTWAPTAAKTIKKTISEMSNVTLVEPVVTIRSAYKPADDAAFCALCDALCE